jgi:hypothetical protein
MGLIPDMLVVGGNGWGDIMVKNIMTIGHKGLTVLSAPPTLGFGRTVMTGLGRGACSGETDFAMRIMLLLIFRIFIIGISTLGENQGINRIIIFVVIFAIILIFHTTSPDRRRHNRAARSL